MSGSRGGGSRGRGSRGRVLAAYVANKLSLSQQLDESAIVLDDVDIILEVVGGPNKGGRVYGLGSQSSSVNNGNSTRGPSCSTLSPQVSIAMMQDFVQQALNDFGLQNEENLGRRIGKAVESQMSPYERSLLQVQNLLTSMTRRLQGECMTRARSSDEGEVEGDNEDDDLGEDDLNDD